MTTSYNKSSWPFKFSSVINLDNRPDRWEKIRDSLGELGLKSSRFSAISMHHLGDDQPTQALREFLLRIDGENSKFEHKLLATWACMRSHLAIIAQAKQNNCPAVLIMEDDCEFESYTPAVLQKVKAQLKDQEWDMLYLGGTIKKKGERCKTSRNLLSVTCVRLAHAYLVNSTIYDKILNEAPTSGLPIDWYYSEKLLPEISGFIVQPILAQQRLLDMSDIEQVVRRPKLKTRQSVKRFISKLIYRK
ncbi:MAG: hypothetical protein B6I36_08865 [Desulfobacteraceae bacterium 4572_35.1]|nr:MAG: hypothetical protein B6I36_08865 [Desulfobacteraceae bacterium 4572_35.1]